MIAIIVAAGEGTRLRHITQGKPKILIEVGGKSILDHLLGWLHPIADEIRLVTKSEYRDFFAWRRDIRVSWKDGSLGEAETVFCGLQDMKNCRSPVLIVLGKKIILGESGKQFQNLLTSENLPQESLISVRRSDCIRNTTHVQIDETGYVRDFVEIRGDGAEAKGWIRNGVDYINDADCLYDVIRGMMSMKSLSHGEQRLSMAYNRMILRGSRFVPIEVNTLTISTPENVREAREYFNCLHCTVRL